MDASGDRDHSKGRFRALASRALKLRPVPLTRETLLAGALGPGFALGLRLGAFVLLNAALMFVYSVLLKRMTLANVVTVSSGFVIRAVAGAVVRDVVFTNRLPVYTFSWRYSLASRSAAVFTPRMQGLCGTGRCSLQPVRRG